MQSIFLLFIYMFCTVSVTFLHEISKIMEKVDANEEVSMFFLLDFLYLIWKILNFPIFKFSFQILNHHHKWSWSTRVWIFSEKILHFGLKICTNLSVIENPYSRPRAIIQRRPCPTLSKMSTKSPGPQRCQLILQQCLAIQLGKPGHTPEDFWMYDSGYMIFQVGLWFGFG